MRRVPRHGERGAALFAVIGAAVVVMLLVVGVLLATRAISERSRRAIDDARGRAPADLGANTYLRALNVRISGEHNDFHLAAATAAQKAQVLELLPSGSVIIPNSQLPGNLGKVDVSTTTGVPTDSRFTYRICLDKKAAGAVGGQCSDTSSYAYWQIFSLVRPDWRAAGAGAPQSGSKVIVYFRGWTGTKQIDGNTATAITRVEFRPTRFGDFQMIVDGRLKLAAGARVEAPIHSNGFAVSLFGTPAAAATQPAIDAPSITCGRDARFSTSSGPIDVGGAGCSPNMQRHDTGGTINVRAIGSEALFAWNLCGGAGKTYTSPDRTYEVICRGGGTTTTVNVGNLGTKQSTVLVVDGAVRVKGQVKAGRRVSIIAYDVSTAGTATGASITVTGDTGHVNGGMLGLFAGDDVILNVDASSPCRVRTIRAAVIASSGSLSLPETWRVPFKPTGAPLCPDTFTLDGSLASHFVPFLVLQSNAPTNPEIFAGFRHRTYKFDPAQKDMPPPAMPLVSQWQQYGYDSVNKSCFDAASFQLLSINCA